MPAVALPVGRLGLQAPAHDEEFAVLLDQRRQARPVDEQSFVGELDGGGISHAVGDGQPFRHQPLGEPPLALICDL